MNITERRLRAWEHQHLVEPRKTYAFGDLVTLRTLESLRAKKVSTKTIRRIIEVLHGKLRRVKDPLSAAKIFHQGKKLHAEFEGQTIDALSGQMLFNFDQSEVKKLVAFPKEDSKPTRHAMKRILWSISRTV